MNAWSALWLLAAVVVALGVPLLMVPSALAWQERRRREEEAARRRRAQEQLRIVLHVVVDAVERVGELFEVTMRVVNDTAQEVGRKLLLLGFDGSLPNDEPPAATPAPVPDTEPPAPKPGALVIPGPMQVFTAPPSSRPPTVAELTGGDGWKPLGTALAADGVQFSYGDATYDDEGFDSPRFEPPERDPERLAALVARYRAEGKPPTGGYRTLEQQQAIRDATTKDDPFRVDPDYRPAWTAPLPGSELARLFAGEPPYRVHLPGDPDGPALPGTRET